MILCDTNILIEFYKNNPEINAVLRSAGHTNLAVSIITQAELYFGALNKNELESIQRHLALITCIQNCSSAIRSLSAVDSHSSPRRPTGGSQKTRLLHIYKLMRYSGAGVRQPGWPPLETRGLRSRLPDPPGEEGEAAAKRVGSARWG